MNIEKLVDGVKVFVRKQIYGEHFHYCAYPKLLHTSQEIKRTDELKHIPITFMLDTYPKEFLEELDKEYMSR